MNPRRRAIIERARFVIEDDSTDLTNPRRRRKRGETIKVGFSRRRPLLEVRREPRLPDGPLSPLGHS